MLEIFNNIKSLQKKIQLAEVDREAPTSWTTPFRMKDCSLSFSRLISNSLSELLSSSQSLFLVFFTDKPLKKISLEYTGQICWNRIFFFADGKSLKKKLNARQSENFLEFLQNLFFLSFESILINYRNKGNVTETIFMHLEIPVCIAPPGLSLRVICFF